MYRNCIFHSGLKPLSVFPLLAKAEEIPNCIFLEERKAIGRANYLLLNVGDAVFSSARSNNQLGVVVDKVAHNCLPTLLIDWGNGTPIPEMPWLLEVF